MNEGKDQAGGESKNSGGKNSSGSGKRDGTAKGLSQTVAGKADRRIRARRTRERSIWFGLGMFGMVGWSVAVTTLVGVALGVWIDRTWPDRYSWTLTLLFIGLIVGCLNAWYWVKRESRHDGED